MRVALLTLLALLAVVPAAGAAERLDALARELRERPLAVDTELSWVLDRADEDRLVRLLAGSEVDFHVALLPQLEADESGGDGGRIAAALQRRLKRPGIYLVIDQHGAFRTLAHEVPRRLGFLHLARPRADLDLSRDVVGRVAQLVAEVAAAPAGETSDPRPSGRPRRYEWPHADSQETPRQDATWWSAILGGGVGMLAGRRARRVARAGATPQARGPLRRRRRTPR